MVRYVRVLALSLAAASLALPSNPAEARTLDATFDIANFTPGALITNAYWPLLPGTQFVFRTTSADGCEVELFAITGNVKSDFQGAYAGMSAWEIHDQSWLDPACSGHYALQEDTFDWHAQDRAGNVWYLGEDSTAWDAASCPSREGSWVAGTDGAEAGIIMLADPKVGDAYRQEYQAGVAEDWGKVLRTQVPVSTGLGSYDSCLETKEWSPLERGAVEHKYYCKGGVGNVLIMELKGGKTLRTEYIGDTLPPGDYAATGRCP
jgi:hypothetical protein